MLEKFKKKTVTFPYNPKDSFFGYNPWAIFKGAYTIEEIRQKQLFTPEGMVAHFNDYLSEDVANAIAIRTTAEMLGLTRAMTAACVIMNDQAIWCFDCFVKVIEKLPIPHTTNITEEMLQLEKDFCMRVFDELFQHNIGILVSAVYPDGHVDYTRYGSLYAHVFHELYPYNTIPFPEFRYLHQPDHRYPISDDNP